MAAEQSQEVGRDGAYRAKWWLDATTRVTMPWIVYEYPAPLRVIRPDGTTKYFDIGGHFLDGEYQGRQILGEVKRYSDAGNQGTEYRKYLADCYFKALNDGPDGETHFIWVTWHPFSLREWGRLCDADTLSAAVKLSDHLADTAVDDQLCNEIAGRLWLVVLHDKQEQHLSLTEAMLGEVRRATTPRRPGGGGDV